MGSIALALAQWLALLAIPVFSLLAAVGITTVRHGLGWLWEPALVWRFVGLMAMACGVAITGSLLWPAVGIDALLTPSTLLPVSIGLAIGYWPLAVALGADEPAAPSASQGR